MLILDAAKRVSLVTAVSPRALVDVAYVVFEAGRLIRRLAELYGGRPGTLGFFRLARDVLAHLAVTGSIAVGDSFVQQIVGHGLAARLSAKLGEGVVNGMMTARIGIAAMETARPLPFSAVKRPGMSDFLSALTAFATRKAGSRNHPERLGLQASARRQHCAQLAIDEGLTNLLQGSASSFLSPSVAGFPDDSRIASPFSCRSRLPWRRTRPAIWRRPNAT